jgi:hypothetical protein
MDMFMGFSPFSSCVVILFSDYPLPAKGLDLRNCHLGRVLDGAVLLATNRQKPLPVK